MRTAASIWARLDRVRTSLLRSGRQICGIPDYDTYLAHCRAHHPDRAVMTFEEFFRYRIEARYGGKGGNTRCC